MQFSRQNIGKKYQNTPKYANLCQKERLTIKKRMEKGKKNKKKVEIYLELWYIYIVH